MSFALACSAWGAHLPGGSITYTCLGNNQYEVILQLWRECTGAPMIDQSLKFSNDCGVSFTLNSIPEISMEDASPVCEDQVGHTTCDGGQLIGIQLYTYRTTLFLSPCNSWTISWDVCCRNASVNLVGEQGIYIEARLNNANGVCVTSPTFTENRPPFACVDQPVSYDLGVTGGTQSNLRFRLIAARRALPDVQDVSYQFPYSGDEPFTGLVLDTITGNITFTPTIQGYIVVVVEVDLYDANGVWRGSIMRDFPFVAEVCSNHVPDAASGTVTIISGDAVASAAYTVDNCSSDHFCLSMEVVDTDADQELSLTSNVDMVLPGASFEVMGTNPAVATICWDPTGASPGTRTFTISALDDACPVRGSQSYTYVVNVGTPTNAGTSSTVQFCDVVALGDTISLLGGTPDHGGAWSDLGDGVLQYEVEGVGGCVSSSATLTIEVVASSNAGVDGEAEVCAVQDPFAMVDLLANADNGGTWIIEGVAHDGMFDPAMDAAGTYCYVMQASAPCLNDTACATITILDPTDPICISLGISEIGSDVIHLSPNPSTGRVVVTGMEMTCVRAEVLDAQGRIVYAQRMHAASTLQVDLPAGVINGAYMLRLHFADGTTDLQRFELLR
ncbi:MAG: T9SS type A sorting domain-containing protein [Flavobacteriales bacterium]|nr:T9SS type A sorting domain-containing protein [Flavobacteriales bacterium]